MNELVTIKNNQIFTDTLIIANGINRRHVSVVRNIQRYENDFKDLGKVELAVRPSSIGKLGLSVRPSRKIREAATGKHDKRLGLGAADWNQDEADEGG